MAASNHVVAVDLPGARYEITVQVGLLDHAGHVLVPLTASRKVAVISDTHVQPRHAATLLAGLDAAGFEAVSAALPVGESHKTLLDLLPIYDRLLEARLERATPIIALGGGVVGDMAGFVAATLLRGVPFVQAPTTLLAMVDASVGGKTGINHAVGKNLIGAFHQPIAVLVDPSVLRTLPPRELRSGLAECIKHDLIRDAEGFANLERNIGRALELDMDYLTELVAHNVAIKARVVERDPFEKGERAHLNFGHTFGHAIEKVSGFAYSHGESVALGMVAAAHVSVALGLIDGKSFDRIVAILQSVSLPTRGLTLSADAVLDAMAFDKKVAAGHIRFVLLDKIGKAVIRDDVPPQRVRDAVESLR